jgi:HD-like signal output (HDOD) protein/CheY-like chemotaxis protein
MKRILFVNDETKILDGIRRMLHADRRRWHMEFASSGEAALQMFEAAPFDVVISDMRMPGMDGAQLLAQIRDRYPSATRIILSGYSETECTTRAIPVAHSFLSKPCDATTLQTTIERTCALQELLSTPEIRKAVGGFGELPSLSSTYLALTQVLKDPNASVNQVAEILGHDVAMSAKVLQLVNSAFFGLGHSVVNLRDATSYLGMDTIKNLALVTETFRVYKPNKNVSVSEFKTMQQHAHHTAAIAARFPLSRVNRDITIVAALLHDIGTLLLASKMPETYRATLDHAREYNCRRFEAEEELLGASHAEIGAYLLGLWGIPNLAIEAIAHHHRPDRISHSGLDCSIAVYVADLLAHECEARAKGHTDVELSKADLSCLESLGVLPQLEEFRELARSYPVPSET